MRQFSEIVMVKVWLNFFLQESVLSRTSHVLSSLALAESESAKLARIEDLISHLKQYPEAKHGAVKVSIILWLLYKKTGKMSLLLYD